MVLLDQAPHPDGPCERDLLLQIEGIRVTYPRWQRIVDEIGRCHELGPLATEPPCLLLVGPTGAGKSTLVGSYARQYPPLLTETGATYPVVRATIPTPATIKALATTLLAALGDPRATSGTVGTMTYRLTRYVHDCGVELLILDELQHFRDRDNRKVLENASNWLKTLIKETGVACVLVGLQGEAEEVVRLNPQLARLFGDPHVLAPFTWDERQPETVREFVTFLTLLEGALPLPERPEFAALGTAQRLHAASGVTFSDRWFMGTLDEDCRPELARGKCRWGVANSSALVYGSSWHHGRLPHQIGVLARQHGAALRAVKSAQFPVSGQPALGRAHESPPQHLQRGAAIHRPFGRL